MTELPDKPIRIILPFRPGGSSDTLAMMLQPLMAAALDREIVLDYVTGGPGGSAGPRAAAAAPADGCTMLMATIGNIALLPNILEDYGIEPLRDLAPVTKIADTADVLIAHPSTPYATVAELAAAAKERPGSITYHGINRASIHMLEFRSLMRDAGIDLKLASMEDGSDGAIDAVIAGDIDLTSSTAPRIIPHIRAGAVKPLAAISPGRIGAMPDLPTMVEEGYPSLRIGSWMGFFVPSATPAPAIAALAAAAKEAAADADVFARAAAAGMDIATSVSPADFRAFVEDETTRLAAAVRDAGLAPG